jgi:single-stranded DNA-specific DHH superfamily exonuclease
MLTDKQILEIRDHLEKAQNPVFFYDNDADGFCSYVLLRRFIGRGKGVVVRSHPDVDEGYAKKAQELNADYVFVLDRPILGEKFVEEIGKLQLPIVWIDHHEMDKENIKGVSKFNPNIGKKKSNEPVCYWAYRVANRVEDSWIALMGCMADHYLPDFFKEFGKKNPELWGLNIKKPFDAYYRTEIGRLARVIGFALKDSITHVVQMQNFLIKCKSPGDMLAEMESNRPFARKYKEIKVKYNALLDRAKKDVGEKVIFFNYGGDLSISAEISNELSYFYPKNVIVVAYSSGPITNVSMRGRKVRNIIKEILPMFENSSGGGHEDAVGARIQTQDIERFKEEIKERVK